MFSWDGKGYIHGTAQLAALDSTLQGIVFNSNQAAISSALEALGSRYQPISVVMPVTASYDTLLGVLRSSARPVVVDVDPVTLQADADQVSEVLKDMEEGVVLLTRPAGQPVTQALFEAVQDVPTICDTRILPTETTMSYTFNIYDLECLAGRGSVLYTKSPEVQADLRIIRHDSSTELSELLAAFVSSHLDKISSLPKGEKYKELLDNAGKSGIIGYGGVAPYGAYLLRVEDAAHAQAVLRANGISTMLGARPLYTHPTVRDRFPPSKNLDYPGATAAFGKFLLVPDHASAPRERILELIWNNCCRG